MRSLRINIVLPFITTKPNGGAKIMYEYANRLASRGHQVTVLHSIKRPYRKIKSPLWWKQLTYRLRGLSSPPWFALTGNVKSLIVPEIIDKYVPDGDITMCTWWEMTYMISRLSRAKGKPFNLIQDYEVWKGHEELVHGAYKLPVQHLVIAKYLQELVALHSGKVPAHIPNAIDTDKFHITVAPEERVPHSVIMLYSKEPRKGTATGLDALHRLHRQYPDLRVDLFGVYDKPSLPEWISYHQRPTDLPALMNRNAVFFTPSLGEGWALPPAEAMASGCAVVCTQIGGHADYAIDGSTALLVSPENVKDMTDTLTRFFNDDALRIRIARQGHEHITKSFNWQHSVELMEQEFEKVRV